MMNIFGYKPREEGDDNVVCFGVCGPRKISDDGVFLFVLGQETLVAMAFLIV